MRRSLLWSMVVVATLVSGCSASPSPQRFEFAEIIMGVEARLTLYADTKASARATARAAFDRLDELEHVMSDYRDDSELMRLGRTSGRAVRVSADLARVLGEALRMAAASDGAFDPTVGPFVQLWRDARRTGRLPDDAALADARERTGWRHVHLDAAGRTVSLARPGLRLDLGGIGKGFAADEAVATLAAHGIDRCLLDLGGDLVAGAPPPGRAGRRVAIESSDPAAAPVAVDLVHAAVATSGDAHQFADIGGVRYSHIIDPRTGLGGTRRVAVTVFARTGATADALASVVAVLGPERGLPVVDRFPPASARVETLTEAGWVRTASPAFPRPGREPRSFSRSALAPPRPGDITTASRRSDRMSTFTPTISPVKAGVDGDVM